MSGAKSQESKHQVESVRRPGFLICDPFPGAKCGKKNPSARVCSEGGSGRK